MSRYLAILRGTAIVGMVYRFGYFFAILGNLLYIGIVFFLWRSIYQGKDVLRGLTFNETMVYIALGSTVFFLLKTYSDWIIHYEIREGIIATYLIKPMDFQLYALFAVLGSTVMNIFAISIPTILFMVFVLKVTFAVGIGLALFPLSFVFALVISFCIDFFVGLLGFYSESVWGISSVKEIILMVSSGALIPLQFFPEGIRNILLWLPFQAVFHTPLMMVTKPDLGLGTFIPMLAVQTFWAVALIVLTRLFYNQAIKVLRISGG
jgi:ABC-2 type transport system permease protein